MTKIIIDKIACDLDGVAYDFGGFLNKRAIPHFEKKGKEEIEPLKFDVQDRFDCTEKEAKEFWYKYIWEYAWLSKLNPDFKDVYNYLAKNGFELPIITARAHASKNNWQGKIQRSAVEFNLKLNGLKKNQIIYCDEKNTPEEKFRTMQKLGVNALIDDSFDNCKKVADNGLIAFLYNQPWNSTEQLNGTNIIRVNNAYQVLENIYNLSNSEKIVGFDYDKLSKDKFEKSKEIKLSTDKIHKICKKIAK